MKRKAFLNIASVEKRLYTLPEGAKYLGRSVWSIRELIWHGKLPRVKVGRRVHVDVRDLEEFVRKHKGYNDENPGS